MLLDLANCLSSRGTSSVSQPEFLLCLYQYFNLCPAFTYLYKHRYLSIEWSTHTHKRCWREREREVEGKSYVLFCFQSPYVGRGYLFRRLVIASTSMFPTNVTVTQLLLLGTVFSFGVAAMIKMEHVIFFIVSIQVSTFVVGCLWFHFILVKFFSVLLTTDWYIYIVMKMYFFKHYIGDKSNPVFSIWGSPES